MSFEPKNTIDLSLVAQRQWGQTYAGTRLNLGLSKSF